MGAPRRFSETASSADLRQSFKQNLAIMQERSGALIGWLPVDPKRWGNPVKSATQLTSSIPTKQAADGNVLSLERHHPEEFFFFKLKARNRIIRRAVPALVAP
jgi:hypothetical protein